MGFLAWLWYYLWIAPYVLLLVLFGGMLRRGLYREFPVFFVYTGYEVLEFVVMFSLARRTSTTTTQYFAAYCVSVAVSTTLRFGMLSEVFAHLFQDYAVLQRFRRPLFRWGLMGLLLASLALAAYAGGNNADHSWFLMHVAKRSVLILQSGLLLGLFLFARYLNLSWRNPVFGIALGMGVFATVGLAAAAIRAQTGFVYTGYLDYVTMGTYHLCVLIWMFYLLGSGQGRASRGPSEALEKLPEHADIEAWNEELERLLR